MVCNFQPWQFRANTMVVCYTAIPPLTCPEAHVVTVDATHSISLAVTDLETDSAGPFGRFTSNRVLSRLQGVH